MTQPAIDFDAFRDFEARGWEQKADPYDRFFGPVTDRIAEPLLDAAQVGSGMMVLDLATGPGYVAGRAAKRQARVIGIDIAAAMITLASTRRPELAFQVADAEHLPFADGSFDAVVGNFILPHLGQPEQAVAEWSRVLAPGGVLALSMWDSPEHNRLLGVVSDVVASVDAGAPTGIPAGPPTFRFSPDNALTGLVEGAGFLQTAIAGIRFTHPVPDVEQFWNGIVTGTVRTAALFAGQPSSTLSQMRAAFDRIASAFAVDGHLEVPVSVKIVSGRTREPMQT